VGMKSFRGVAAGFSVWLLLAALNFVYLNLISNGANVLVYSMALVGWIFPGYVAGAVAGNKGVLNGAIVPWHYLKPIGIFRCERSSG